MASITLKDLPRSLHRELKMRAKANHRSLNKEAIATLQAATETGGPGDLAALNESSRRARALFTGPVTSRQITAWKRRGRL